MRLIFLSSVVLIAMSTACYAQVAEPVADSSFCDAGSPPKAEKKAWAFSTSKDPEKEQCKLMDVSKLKGYQCDFVKKAFSSDSSGYTFERKNNTYMAFETQAECNNALKTTQANGY